MNERSEWLIWRVYKNSFVSAEKSIAVSSFSIALKTSTCHLYRLPYMLDVSNKDLVIAFSYTSLILNFINTKYRLDRTYFYCICGSLCSTSCLCIKCIDNNCILSTCIYTCCSIYIVLLQGLTSSTLSRVITAC